MNWQATTEWVRSTSGSDILRITVSKVQHAAIFRCARVVNIKLLGEHSIIVLLRVSLHWLVECDVDGVLLYHARLFYFIVMLIALSSTFFLFLHYEILLQFILRVLRVVVLSGN